MIVSFDCDKRRTNFIKHGLDLADACQLFRDRTLDEVDDRYDYGEVRWLSIGRVGMKIVVCVWTELGDQIRVISLRDADRAERLKYERRDA